MKARVFDLSRVYELHGVAFDAVELRAPTANEYWRIGKVEEWQPVPGGGAALVTYREAIKEYADVLVSRVFMQKAAVTAPAGVVDVLDLSDTLKLEAEVVAFFTEAAKSNRPATSSSGSPDKDSATSEAAASVN